MRLSRVLITAACLLGVTFGAVTTAEATASVPPPAPHAVAPAGPFLTPVPEVTIDAASAPDLTPWLQQSVLPTIRSWYPVIADELATPDYVSYLNVVVTADESYTLGPGYADGNRIVISASWARSNLTDLGMVIHEMTHVIQNWNGSSSNGWLIEGTADHSREFIYQDRAPVPPKPSDTYRMGYSPASYFLEYVQRTYSATLIHDANVALHRGTYTDDFFVQQTGKSVDALWAEMMAKIVGPALQVKNGGKCLAFTGMDLQLQSCTVSTPRWNQFTDILTGSTAAATSLRVNDNGSCLDDKFSGTASGTTVWLYGCNNGGAQSWTRRPNGSLYNPASGKCLEAVGGGLVINSCRAAVPGQRWTYSRGTAG